ncbi:hypothetical protein DSO57_1014587 [Entomophthora muscae]|uniref:Uncharacterized protein n=1 Tax=Entomophthora muscae TaxID=34485 RepID=A0ACC2TGS0_9FUNG|nr:hypothetical protein DSO57_1014587 [Entomophthora muscae]
MEGGLGLGCTGQLKIACPGPAKPTKAKIALGPKAGPSAATRAGIVSAPGFALQKAKIQVQVKPITQKKEEKKKEKKKGKEKERKEKKEEKKRRGGKSHSSATQS